MVRAVIIYGILLLALLALIWALVLHWTGQPGAQFYTIAGLLLVVLAGLSGFVTWGWDATFRG